MIGQPSVAEFREEVLTFLESNARRKPEDLFVWGKGEDQVGFFVELDGAAEQRALQAAREWRACRFDAGLGNIVGAPEHGGRQLSSAHERLYLELEALYDVPDQWYFDIGVNYVAPTIRAYGMPHIQDMYLSQLYRGDVVSCQLFSEPGAGSDLAGLQTRARRDGQEWVVTGQKVWTSGAHYSEIAEIICRTDPELAKHKGLTVFLVDMHAPGVTVRPLRQMTGGSSFNEVFLDEVRIPDDHRLGAVNEGWSVALATLMNERASIGGSSSVGTPSIARMAAMLQHFDGGDDPILRHDLAQLYVGIEVARLTAHRRLEKIIAGEAPGPEMSLGKLVVTRNLASISAFVSKVLGARLMADTGEWGTYAWAKFVCGVPGLRIGGGTDEVQRNIIAERVLGLPK
jgi:acyl-CoA dehydrogenase